MSLFEKIEKGIQVDIDKGLQKHAGKISNGKTNENEFNTEYSITITVKASQKKDEILTTLEVFICIDQLIQPLM